MNRLCVCVCVCSFEGRGGDKLRSPGVSAVEIAGVHIYIDIYMCVCIYSFGGRVRN